MDWVLSILTKWQSLAVFISAGASIFLAFVAIYQDRLRAFVSRPKLDLESGPFYPDAERIPLTDQNTGVFIAEAVYLQIRIRNDGHTAAEMVEVFVAKLEQEINGIFSEVVGFYPLNLRWRHYNTVFLDRLSPDTGRDCTLGRIVDPAQRLKVGDDHPRLRLPVNRAPFRLSLATIPNTRTDLLAPGKYRLYLEIGASNVRHPKRRTIELVFPGEWLPNTREMAVAKIV